MKLACIRPADQSQMLITAKKLPNAISCQNHITDRIAKNCFTQIWVPRLLPSLIHLLKVPPIPPPPNQSQLPKSSPFPVFKNTQKKQRWQNERVCRWKRQLTCSPLIRLALMSQRDATVKMAVKSNSPGKPLQHCRDMNGNMDGTTERKCAIHLIPGLFCTSHIQEHHD